MKASGCMSRQAARVSAARRPTVPCEQPPPPDLTKPQLPKSFFVRVGINNTMPQSSVFFFFFPAYDPHRGVFSCGRCCRGHVTFSRHINIYLYLYLYLYLYIIILYIFLLEFQTSWPFYRHKTKPNSNSK